MAEWCTYGRTDKYPLYSTLQNLVSYWRHCPKAANFLEIVLICPNHPLGDIIRALGNNVTNKKIIELGGAAALGEKRIAFADFGGILAAVKADLSATGVKEDYIEGLKVRS